MFWGTVFIQLLIFEDLEVPTHKTKNIVNYYNQMENTKKLLLVDGGPIDEKLKLSTQNLHYVNILPAIVSFSFYLFEIYNMFLRVKAFPTVTIGTWINNQLTQLRHIDYAYGSNRAILRFGQFSFHELVLGVELDSTEI